MLSKAIKIYFSISSILLFKKARLCSLIHEKDLAVHYLEKAFILNPNLKTLAKNDVLLDNLRFFQSFNNLFL